MAWRGARHALVVALSFAGVARLAAAEGLGAENLAWAAYVHVLTASVLLELAGWGPLARAPEGSLPGAGAGPVAAPGAASAHVPAARALWVFAELAACGAAARGVGAA